jgi:hypothetical protein
MPLLSVFVENQDRRRPQDVKAMEAGGILFDVNFNGSKGLVDPGGELRVGVRLGFQPSACASTRGGAEIDENRPVLCLGRV